MDLMYSQCSEVIISVSYPTLFYIQTFPFKSSTSVFVFDKFLQFPVYFFLLFKFMDSGHKVHIISLAGSHWRNSVNWELNMICTLLHFLHRLMCWTNTCFWRPSPWSTLLISQRKITSEKRTSGRFAFCVSASPATFFVNIQKNSTRCLFFSGWRKSRSG